LRRLTAPQVRVLAVLALALAAPGSASAQAPRPAQLGVAASGGLHNFSASEIGRELDIARDAGARWIRFDMNWAVVQDAGKHRWNWAPFDRVVRAARARNLKVLGTIWYTPAWARPGGTPAHRPPTLAKNYGRFAGRAARRYKTMGVHHWEIWNEPNIPHAWDGGVNVKKYGAMLRSAARGIRRNDRRGVVITGGLSPAPNGGGSLAPATFLSRLYRAGFRRSFDHVGHHTSMFPYRPSTRGAWSPWRQMAWTRPSLRGVMKRHGNGKKKIWVTEYGAPTGGDRAVSEAKQAALLTEGFRLWARYKWGGPLFWYAMRDRGPESWHTRCGLARHDFSRKRAFAAYRAIANAARR
jgi:hypothetical protein